MTSTAVRVGVGVLVPDPLDPSRVFCGIRVGSHGAGTLALPGGHLEMYESWEECAAREVLEECDLKIQSLRLLHVTNDPMESEGKHYVTLFMFGTCVDESPPQQPKLMEPHKCKGWISYSWDALKEEQRAGKLFGPLDKLVSESPDSVLQALSPSTSL